MNAFSSWESYQRIGACHFTSVLEKHTAAQRATPRSSVHSSRCPRGLLPLCVPSVLQITCVAYQWSAVAGPSWLGAQSVMRIDVTAKSCVFHPRFVFHLTPHHGKVYSSRWQATLSLPFRMQLFYTIFALLQGIDKIYLFSYNKQPFRLLYLRLEFILQLPNLLKLFNLYLYYFFCHSQSSSVSKPQTGAACFEKQLCCGKFGVNPTSFIKRFFLSWLYRFLIDS